MLADPQDATSTVLLVDDDNVTRQLVRTLLQKFGYKVDECSTAGEAMARLCEVRSSRYDLVISDYWMPGENGLELLKSILREDPALSVVLMTADEEREILQSLIRHGGCGFVQKPISPSELKRCVDDARSRTARLRDLGEVETEARELGESQRALMLRHLNLAWPELEMYFTSKSQASGDFVSIIPIGEDRKILIASDGSGHDLSSAFQSNYFHGLARGMLTAGKSIQDVFVYFNELMLSEWNNDSTCGLSLAVCALDFDRRGKVVGHANAGFPRPMISGLDGFAKPLGDEIAAPPLGWFSGDFEVSQDCLEVGCYYVWTDGLSDHADQMNIDPLALAHRILANKSEDSKLIKGAQDDIAVVRLVDPFGLHGSVKRYPLASVSLSGDQLDRIDQWQTYFENSIRAALKHVDGELLAEVMLCLREGLINALQHGCGGDPEQSATVMVSYCTESDELALLIQDQGAGHEFDTSSHAAQLGTELISEHRGMMIMESIPKRFSLRDRGRTVHMEFSLN